MRRLLALICGLRPPSLKEEHSLNFLCPNGVTIKFIVDVPIANAFGRAFAIQPSSSDRQRPRKILLHLYNAHAKALAKMANLIMISRSMNDIDCESWNPMPDISDI